MEEYRYFLTIAETRNLSAAAGKLFMSQPSLSKFLKQLEQSMGVMLFDRNKRPLELTRAGELYYQYILDVMERKRKLMVDLNEFRPNDAQTLRVGIGPWRGSCILPSVLPEFKKKFPKTALSFIEVSSQAMNQLLFKNEADLCIMGDGDISLFAQKELLCHESIYLAGNRSHPLVHRLLQSKDGTGSFISVDLRLFSDEQFLMTPETNLFAKMIQNYFSTIQFWPKSIIRIPNLATELHMVEHMTEQDFYFAFIPEIGIRTLALASNVAFFRVGNPGLLFSIGAAYRRDAPLSPAGRGFIDTVREFYARFYL